MNPISIPRHHPFVVRTVQKMIDHRHFHAAVAGARHVQIRYRCIITEAQLEIVVHISDVRNDGIPMAVPGTGPNSDISISAAPKPAVCQTDHLHGNIALHHLLE